MYFLCYDDMLLNTNPWALLFVRRSYSASADQNSLSAIIASTIDKEHATRRGRNE